MASDEVSSSAARRAVILALALLICLASTALAMVWGGWWSFGLIGYLALPFLFAEWDEAVR